MLSPILFSATALLAATAPARPATVDLSGAARLALAAARARTEAERKAAPAFRRPAKDAKGEARI